jgi:hypothetical protein
MCVSAKPTPDLHENGVQLIQGMRDALNLYAGIKVTWKLDTLAAYSTNSWTSEILTGKAVADARVF